jgi:hypothetical protein
MPCTCFALWRNRNGQQLWDGPFPDNKAAQARLNQVIDKSGGSLVATVLPAYRPSEVRMAEPILGSWAIQGRESALPAEDGDR